MFKLNEIKELIKWVDKSSLEEFEIETEGSRISMRKPGRDLPIQTVAAHAPAAVTPHPPHAVSHQPAAPQQAHAAESGKTQEAEAPAKAANTYEITSPMVGTFYEAPAPDSQPFVKVGDKVKKNTVVCIVEAMKLMNEIEAEVEGEIVDILVDNGQLVEYGQPMFVVRTQ